MPSTHHQTGTQAVGQVKMSPTRAAVPPETAKAPEFGVYPRRAVGAPRMAVNLGDDCCQLDVADGMG